jgi:hypothetical protein
MPMGSKTGATDALTIIAEALCATDSPYCVESMMDEDAKDVLDLLTTKGYRIIGPEGVAALGQVIDFIRNHSAVQPGRTTRENLDRLAALIGDDND